MGWDIGEGEGEGEDEGSRLYNTIQYNTMQYKKNRIMTDCNDMHKRKIRDCS